MNPVDAVLQTSRSSPAAIAVASADFEMTYAELASSLVRFAGKFRQLGIRSGSVVAVSARPAVEAVVALALLHEGAVSLSGTPSVLRAYGKDIDFIVTDSPLLDSGGAEVITIGSGFLEELGAVSARIRPRLLDAASLCRIVFSSGTTGTPKGVGFTVGMLAARTDAARRNWMPDDPFMCLLGLDTVSGIQTFYWSMFHGETYFIPSTGERNLHVITRFGVRSIKTSPARLRDLIDAVEAGPGTLAIETVQVAGSLLSPALAERSVAALGGVPVYLYGSSEVGTVTTGVFDPARPHVVGRLIREVDFELVDDDGRPITSAGVEGAIRYRSDVMPAGYWLAAPHADSPFRGGWFYPGDVGSWSFDGELSLSGRSDDVVNASGAKFNLAELDIWLGELRLFQDAASFTFVGVDGIAVGIAFVAKAHVGSALATEQLRVRFPNVVVGALLKLHRIPRNHAGKVDRSVLSGLVRN